MTVFSNFFTFHTTSIVTGNFNGKADKITIVQQ